MLASYARCFDLVDQRQLELRGNILVDAAFTGTCVDEGVKQLRCRCSSHISNCCLYGCGIRVE